MGEWCLSSPHPLSHACFKTFTDHPTISPPHLPSPHHLRRCIPWVCTYLPHILGSSANSSFWICSRLCSPLSRRVVIYDMQGPYWLPDLVARGSWNELEMNIMPQLIVCIILHLIPHFSLPWNSIDQSCLCESTIWEGYCHSIPLFDLFSQAEARGWAWLARNQPKEQKKKKALHPRGHKPEIARRVW